MWPEKQKHLNYYPYEYSHNVGMFDVIDDQWGQ